MARTITINGVGAMDRLGFGAMRITGPGVWGEPEDLEAAHAVLRAALDHGVELIDTADSYGPEVSERLIAETLHPYPAGLHIATKAGQVRPGPHKWVPVGRPEYLRQQLELSLRRLKLDAIDLFQLHRVDPKVDAADQFGELAKFQSEGKVRAVGLSAVSIEQIEEAGRHFTVASVQNRYNVADRSSQDVLEYCTAHGIPFIPYAPLDSGRLFAAESAVDAEAARLGATRSQITLAWLLQKSPMMVPIPGTSRPEHLVDNLKAWDLALDAKAVAALDASA